MGGIVKAVVKAVSSIVDTVKDIVKSDIFKMVVKMAAIAVGSLWGPMGAALANVAVGALYGETSLKEIGFNALAGFAAGGMVPDIAGVVSGVVGVGTIAVISATAVTMVGMEILAEKAITKLYDVLPKSWSNELKIAATAAATLVVANFTTKFLNGSYAGAGSQVMADTTVTKLGTTLNDTTLTMLDKARAITDSSRLYDILSAVSKATGIAATAVAEEAREFIEEANGQIAQMMRELDEMMYAMEESIMITQSQGANNFPTLAGGKIYNARLAGGMLYQMSDVYQPGQILFGDFSHENKYMDNQRNIPFAVGYAGTVSYTNGIVL